MADQATQRQSTIDPWNPNKQRLSAKQVAPVQRKVQRRPPEPQYEEDGYEEEQEEQFPVRNTGRYQKQVPMNLPERRVIRPPQEYIDAHVEYIQDNGYQRAMPAQEMTYEKKPWLVTHIFFYGGSIPIAIIGFFILVFRHLHIFFH